MQKGEEILEQPELWVYTRAPTTVTLARHEGSEYHQRHCGVLCSYLIHHSTTPCSGVYIGMRSDYGVNDTHI